MNKVPTNIQLKILLVISVVVLVALIIAGIMSTRSNSGTASNNTQTTTAVPTVDQTRTAVDYSPYYDITLPAGFDKIVDQQYRPRTKESKIAIYFNKSTGSFFEVSVDQTSAIADADLLWTYTYSSNKTLSLSKPTSCYSATGGQCTTSADKRLDGVLKPQYNSTKIAGVAMTFHFGNINSDSTANLQFVDDFVAAFKFK